MSSYLRRTEKKTYYVLKGNGQYYSHQVGTTVHMVKDPERAAFWNSEKEAIEFMREERISYDVVPIEMLALPMPRPR